MMKLQCLVVSATFTVAILANFIDSVNSLEYCFNDYCSECCCNTYSNDCCSCVTIAWWGWALISLGIIVVIAVAVGVGVWRRRVYMTRTVVYSGGAMTSPIVTTTTQQSQQQAAGYPGPPMGYAPAPAKPYAVY